MADHPLDGARERLKRANENIRNLNAEVTQFLAPFPRIKIRLNGVKPIIGKKQLETFEILRKQALSGTTLPRFSILAGEIVHHLRCVFDHIVWQLSASEIRDKSPNDVEFPVFAESPKPCKWTPKEVKHSRYCRKVKGITSPTALARIESMQPYLRKNPSEHPLMIIHDMDRFDKHRELLIVIHAVAVQMDTGIFQTMQTIKDSATGGLRILGPMGPPKVKVHSNVFAQVAFAQFGEGENETLIPFLENLASFTANAIELFAEEF